MTPAPVVVRILRFVFAILGLTAILWIPIRDAEWLSITNYLSYFTIESNIAAALVLIVGAVRDPHSRGWQMVRGAVTLYMVITGVVYAALLADVDVTLNDAWIDTVLHRILPLVLFADWVLFPARQKISAAAALTWLAFPAVYTVYTLIRGPIVSWYPYPFLDPGAQSSTAFVIGLVVLVAALAVMALMVNAVGGLGARRRYRTSSDVESDSAAR